MRRADLRADCARCAAVCCSAASFERSEDFGCDKRAGERCVHLRGDDCGIYARRIELGFAGCVAFDCYGAGPRVSRAWAAASAAERDEAFLVLRALHEQLFLLTEAKQLCPPREAPLHAALDAAIASLDAHAAAGLDALCALDVAAFDARARALLLRVGAALGGRRAPRRLQVLR